MSTLEHKEVKAFVSDMEADIHSTLREKNRDISQNTLESETKIVFKNIIDCIQKEYNLK